MTYCCLRKATPGEFDNAKDSPRNLTEMREGIVNIIPRDQKSEYQDKIEPRFCSTSYQCPGGSLDIEISRHNLVLPKDGVLLHIALLSVSIPDIQLPRYPEKFLEANAPHGKVNGV